MMHSCEIAHCLGIDLPDQGEAGHADVHAEQLPPDGCDHCHFCETLLSGGVASRVVQVKVPGFVALLPLWQPVLATLFIEQTQRVTAVIRSDQHSPPQRWRFTERTALPPRAPSHVA